MTESYSNKIPHSQPRLTLLLCLCVLSTVVFAEEDKPAVDIEAQQLQSEGKKVRAVGDVRAHFSNYKLCAGEVEYDRDTGLVRAVDGVKLIHAGHTVQGSHLDYNTNTTSGTVRDFNLELANQQLRLRGDHMSLNQQRIQANEAVITSCPATAEDWRLRVGEAQGNLDEGLVTIYDTILEIAGVPVMYLPYARFYYDDRRHSGFLWPQVSFGSAGLGLSVPYYFSLADNYDWTVTPNLHPTHGLELANEFRFLTPTSRAQIDLNSVLFEGEGRGRQALQYDWFSDSSPWRLKLNADNVSDDRYLVDFSDSAGDRAVRNLPRLAQLEYVTDNWWLSTQAEHFKTLDNNLITPHRALPIISLTQIGQQTDYSWENQLQYGRFLHNDSAQPSGNRFLWRGSVQRYFYANNLLITPELGMHAVKYQTTHADNATFWVPHGRLQAESRWFNNGITDSAGHDNYRLRMAWIYAPYRRQDNAPLYDTELKRQSLQNLYEWNRFVGGDRFADANFLVYGMEYRAFDKPTISDSAFLGISQRYYLQQPRQRLFDEQPPKQGVGNILMAGRLHWQDTWSVNSDAEWNPRENVTQRFYIDVKADFSNNRLLHAGYLSDVKERVFLGGAIPIGHRLDIAASTDYLLSADRFSSSELALRLRDSCDCWRLSLKVVDSIVKENDNDVVFLLGVELTGLGTVGDDYEDVLNDLR